MKDLLKSIVGFFNPIDDVYGFVKSVVFLITGGLLVIVPSCASYKAGYQFGYTKAKLFGGEVVSPDIGIPSP